MSARARRELERKAAGTAAGGRFEAYKTTHEFDSTHRHPEWLGLRPSPGAAISGRRVA